MLADGAEPAHKDLPSGDAVSIVSINTDRRRKRLGRHPQPYSRVGFRRGGGDASYGSVAGPGSVAG